MSRPCHALGALAWGALIALWLLWWASSFVLAVARWQGGRARFGAVVALGRALVMLGWPEVASGLYAAEAERAEHELRVIRAERDA